MTSPNLGEFTIDPKSDAYKYTKPICEPGNPSNCLIYNFAMLYKGIALRTHLNHDMPMRSWYSITHGNRKYTKPMPKDDIEYARDFDLGKSIRRTLTVSLDLGDGTWRVEPKETRETPKRRKTPGDPVRQGEKGGVRARQLRNIRKAAQLATSS